MTNYEQLPSPEEPDTSPAQETTDSISEGTKPDTSEKTLKERIIAKIEHNMRDSDTKFAKLIATLCPYKGEAYLNSNAKRMLDLTTAVPAALVAAPGIFALAYAVKLQDGGSAFFVHERVGTIRTGPIDLVKIRCMHPDSDKGALNYSIAKDFSPWEDPRNTPLGAFMRRYQLEELPQLFDVISGKLSLMGIRPDTPEGMKRLQVAWSRERYEEWRKHYKQGPLGLSGVNQVFGTQKDDVRRYHLDVFYAQHASLGLDLYLMWRTLAIVLHFELPEMKFGRGRGNRTHDKGFGDPCDTTSPCP